MAYPGIPVNGNSKQPTFLNIESALECQKKCQEFPDNKCQYFTWNNERFPRHSNSCWLKSEKVGEKITLNKISGPKHCVPYNSSECKNDPTALYY